MPQTTVHVYRDASGESPVLDWLHNLRKRDQRAFVACRARIILLAALGHELRRPHTDLLRDGVYELRARVGRVNYRVLYFFHGKNIAILAHGLTKEDAVPEAHIQRAIDRKLEYEKDPATHTAALDL